MPIDVKDKAKSEGVKFGKLANVGNWAADPFVSGPLFNSFLGGGSTKPSYDANIETGQPFNYPQNYTGPALNRSNVPGGGPFDMTRPGAAQQYWNQNQGAMSGPGMMQMFLNKMAPGMMQAGAGERFASDNKRSLSANANLDKFYDRAADRQTGRMNDQLAARGGYNTSAGIDMISEGLADLGAHQAKAESDFQTQRLGMGMQAANQAQQQQLARRGLLGQFSNEADQSALSRFLGGSQVAGQAQRFGDTRAQNAQNNELQRSQAMMQMMFPWLQSMIQGDQGMMMDQFMMELGIPSEAKADDRYDAQMHQNRVQMGLNTAGDVINAGASIAKPTP